MDAAVAIPLAGLEGALVVLGVDDDEPVPAGEGDICEHRGEHVEVCRMALGIPLESVAGGAEVVVFSSVEVADEFFEDTAHLDVIAEQVWEADLAGVLGDQEVVGDEFADIKEESVEAVIAVQFDLAELTRGQPREIADLAEVAQRCTQFGVEAGVELCGGPQVLHGRLHEAVVEHVVGQLVDSAAGLSLGKEHLVDRWAEFDLAADAGDVLTRKDIGPDQTHVSKPYHIKDLTETIRETLTAPQRS